MRRPPRGDAADTSTRRIAALHGGSSFRNPPPPGDGTVRRVDSGARGATPGRPVEPSGPPLGSSPEDADPPHPSLARSRRWRRQIEGVEANARLTGATAAVLFVLFAAEGVTVLRVGQLLTAHVFIGMLLVPPILVKMASTSWRFVRYYAGAPAYRRKGPPPLALRALGPLVVVLTVILFASGIALLLTPTSLRASLLLVHQASFVVWLAVMAVHVLAHVLDMARLAPRDFVARTRRQVRGASARQWLIAASLAVGFLLAAMVVPRVGPWLAAGVGGHPG